MPEKNLDNKIENMLSEDYAEYRKSSISDTEMRKHILPPIKDYLSYLTRVKKADAKRVIYISDSCEINRYDQLKSIIESEIKKSRFKYECIFGDIFDYYDRLDQSDITILIGKYLSGDFPIFIIYTSSAITENLFKKQSTVAPLLEKTFRIIRM